MMFKCGRIKAINAKMAGALKLISRLSNLFSGMDGSNFTKLVTTRLLWPNGLTIDYPTDRVFWADAGTDRIEFVEYDGTNR